MTIIKYLLLLIVLAVLGALVYQNLDYFLTRTPLNLDLRMENWQWTTPELQNIVYLGICFLAGLLLSSGKTLLTKWRLNKIIRTKDEEIAALQERIHQLRTELDVFQHDPYIKKALEQPKHPEQPAAQDAGENPPENGQQEAPAQ